jgi:hypothetical protein
MRFIETPNTETLYSNAVLDLQDGPVVLLHPDLGERYFRTSVWEVHGDARTISQKQDGPKPSPYALLPYGWKGTLPGGLKTIQARSRYLVVAPHIAVYGDADLANVHALQDGFRLIALKDWRGSNKELAAGQPMRPLRRPGTRTSGELLFLEELCETLKDITPRDDELAFARQAERIGVTRADGFRLEKLDAAALSWMGSASSNSGPERSRHCNLAARGWSVTIWPTSMTGCFEPRSAGNTCGAICPARYCFRSPAMTRMANYCVENTVIDCTFLPGRCQRRAIGASACTIWTVSLPPTLFGATA